MYMHTCTYLFATFLTGVCGGLWFWECIKWLKFECKESITISIVCKVMSASSHTHNNVKLLLSIGISINRERDWHNMHILHLADTIFFFFYVNRYFKVEMITIQYRSRSQAHVCYMLNISVQIIHLELYISEY